MARKLRLQYPGAIYHVMNRGDHSEVIFRDDKDRQLLLGTLTEACDKADWHMHALCLMSNHFHFVLETPRANLAEGMKWLLGTYTTRFNRKHHLFGHLFSGRYKAMPVDSSGNGYLKSACDYVHLNPVRAGLLLPEQSLRAYVWSSYPFYLKSPERRPRWLRVDRLLGEWGIPVDSEAGREQFALRMEARRQAEAKGNPKLVERGWCLGGEEFRQELLLQMTTLSESKFGGPEWYESGENKAERMLGEELGRHSWTQVDLDASPKAHPVKVEIARRLRSETTMTWAWIALHLRMGAPGYAANACRNHR
jgi:REP element-mobilizing transposase RayT